MGKGMREEAGEARGSRILMPAPPINLRNAREVAGRLFTSFRSLRGATKALELFVAQMGHWRENENCGANTQTGWDLVHEVVTTRISTTGKWVFKVLVIHFASLELPARIDGIEDDTHLVSWVDLPGIIELRDDDIWNGYCRVSNIG